MPLLCCFSAAGFGQQKEKYTVEVSINTQMKMIPCWNSNYEYEQLWMERGLAMENGKKMEEDNIKEMVGSELILWKSKKVWRICRNII